MEQPPFINQLGFELWHLPHAHLRSSIKITDTKILVRSFIPTCFSYKTENGIIVYEPIQNRNINKV